MPKGDARAVRVLHYMGTNFGMTGVETFILELCAAQKRLGTLPSITLELENRAEVATDAATIGVPVIDFPTRSSVEDSLPRKVGTALLRARRVRALLALLDDVDVLHMHSVGVAGLDAFVAAAIARSRPVVVTHHATLTWFKPMQSRMSDATLWLEKRLAYRAVMPYQAAASELVAGGGLSSEQVAVVPFCVDETRFSARVTPPQGDGLTLVMAARMYPGKGHEYLLRALAKLSPQHPGLKLLLLGDGPGRPGIEAEIAELGLAGVVEIRGRVSHAEMPALLCHGHVIVLPSYMPGETFPLCLLEGMALGMPAIGSRWFGIPDIIEDGETGFVVEPRDVDGLVEAITRFLSSPALYAQLSANARARALERFTSTAVARAYGEIYQAALA
ncbi:MAG: putative glycosyltransferase [Myxococcaceae bacterium]|nr:putative glycosyltransferase [Myxococcaceae bacterium]